MELKAVLQAQAMWFLRPTGTYGYLPKAVSALQAKYSFAKAPTETELANWGTNQTTPLVFRAGTFPKKDRTIDIDVLQIFPHGVLAGTNTSTDDTEDYLGQLTAWAAQTFKIEYEKIAGPAFSSQVEVKLTKPLNAFFPRMKTVCEAASAIVSDFFVNKPPYEVAGITFSFDRTVFMPSPPNFRVERRENAPYVNNLYFSEGPFRTKDHLALLKLLEESLAG